jgi:hypothetical protein
MRERSHHFRVVLIAIVANVNLPKAQDHAVSFSEYFYRGYLVLCGYRFFCFLSFSFGCYLLALCPCSVLMFLNMVVAQLLLLLFIGQTC